MKPYSNIVDELKKLKIANVVWSRPSTILYFPYIDWLPPFNSTVANEHIDKTQSETQISDIERIT